MFFRAIKSLSGLEQKLSKTVPTVRQMSEFSGFVEDFRSNLAKMAIK